MRTARCRPSAKDQGGDILQKLNLEPWSWMSQPPDCEKIHLFALVTSSLVFCYGSQVPNIVHKPDNHNVMKDNDECIHMGGGTGEEVPTVNTK